MRAGVLQMGGHHLREQQKRSSKLIQTIVFWHLVWLASWYDKYLPKKGGGKVKGFVPKGTLQRLDFYAITNSRHDPVSMPT